MKTTIILLSLALLSYKQCFAQKSEGIRISQFIEGGNRSFQIIGAESNSFADSLFAYFQKTKRKGYIWKFKKVEIPGLDTPFTLQVYQDYMAQLNMIQATPLHVEMLAISPLSLVRSTNKYV